MFTLDKMQNQLFEQSILLQEIMITLKQILRQIKDEDIDEEFYNNLFKIIDKTADVAMLHLQLINEN